MSGLIYTIRTIKNKTMNGTLTMEERISKQELQKLYNVDRKTIEDWVQNHNLPMIQISPYKRFVRKSDLLEWENQHFVVG
ncbi:MAG: helix-turn-helix domain-containing protein [Oceanospirillaceae bacterium]|nr:helix-turn-helix domain-containing protein [Oceanospirillaceae bacterium]